MTKYCQQPNEALTFTSKVSQPRFEHYLNKMAEEREL